MQILWPTDNQNALDQMNKHHQGFSHLTNGQFIYHPWYLDGGGNNYRYYFIDVLKKLRKSKYNHAFEWCCGHSIIGFETLVQGYADHLTISDYFDFAVNVSLENAERLGYKDRVTGYITPAISKIPKTEKWDLVISNPPNTFSSDSIVNEGLKLGKTQSHIDLECRITVDNDYEAHREFFQNIKNYLTDGADILLTMHQSVISTISQNLSLPCGFEVVNVFDMIPCDPSLKIVHFKAI